MKTTIKTMTAFAILSACCAVYAAEPLSKKLREEMIQQVEQRCYTMQYIDVLSKDPGAAQLPAEFRDQERFPLADIQQKMRSDPATAKLDKQIVEGCNCMMRPFRDAYSAARTLEDMSAFNRRVNELSKSLPKAERERNLACWERARERNK